MPNEAVFVEGNQAFVYVVKADSTVTRDGADPRDRARRRPSRSSRVSTPGMRVVRAGHQKLYEGAKVMPIQSQGAAASSAAPGAGGAR